MAKYFFVILEALAMLVCLFCYRKFTDNRYKLFLPYLALIVVYELASENGVFMINKSNLWIVNIEITFEFLFYSSFIIRAYRDKKERRIFSTLVALCVLFTVIDVVLIQGVMKLGHHAIVVQYSLLIIMVCRFFYNAMQEFDRGTSLARDPDFWVNTGLLFFFLVEFLFFASFKLAYTHNKAYSNLFGLVSSVANVILYSCLIVSFLCFRRRKKISY